MSIALVPVGEDTLQAVVDEGGGVHVVIARVCEALDIETEPQRRRLQALPWAAKKTSIRPVRDSMGREQATLTVALDALPMWLATIDLTRTKASPAAHAKLVRFQLEARDALAAHFGMGNRDGLPSVRGSGGGAGSGSVPAVRPAAPAGSALEQLAAIEQMGNMLSGLLQVARQNAEALAVVDARVTQTETALVVARADAADAKALADRVMKKSTAFREDARCIKAAVAHISRRIRSWCAYSNVHWQTVYGAARDELGLARSPVVNTTAGSGEPVKQKRPKPLGECIKRADQVLTYARVATKHGVPGCDVATINRILNGDDDSNVVDVDTQAVSKEVH